MDAVSNGIKIFIDLFKVLGPPAIEALAALLRGENPIDVLSKKRVRDLLPEVSDAELALRFRMVQAGLEAADGNSTVMVISTMTGGVSVAHGGTAPDPAPGDVSRGTNASPVAPGGIRGGTGTDPDKSE